MRSMRACWPRVVLAFLLAQLPGNVLAQDPMWENWGKPLADKLERFLPGPVPGLTDRFAEGSEYYDSQPQSGGGCGEAAAVCYLFYPVGATQSWLMADPGLVQEFMDT